ncbi:MAG: anthranilate phosphoribosyltransferase [Gammaproteobacteria bacterium]|nr:MAG: anthranilate phosphoribosyltransferase [Gammaproteobacteria bacterium]
MDMQSAIRAVTARNDLTASDMTAVMRAIMTGEATDAQIGGFLVGLAMKGETVDEIAAAASVMRELATPVRANGDHVVDIVGTGGDGMHTFNVSTACTFVVAAAGGTVAKHGNRSISSKSGAADLLEAAGVRLDLSPERVQQCIETVGVGFMFAPQHHSAMKHAIGPRREMGVRTVFNVLGPLTNPAGAPNMLMGVYADELVEPLAHVLQQLGANHVMVVHAEDGMDEISIGAATNVAELNNGEVTTRQIRPEDFGFAIQNVNDLVVTDARESLSVIRSVFANEPGPARDIVLLNAGAALYCANLADSMEEGIARAEKTLQSGKAAEKLDQLAAFSQKI